ncbi:uncharacterized protein L199_005726 [Kwoniella botswanensis]|uniref:uncharacterized protein n=1 Tax=Kwoniella botswanensis TaxID=1268659 RepID=UPI00315D80A4
MAPAKRSRSPSPSRVDRSKKPCKLSFEDEELMRRNAQREKLKQHFSSSSMTSRTQTKLPFPRPLGPRGTITREYSMLESDSEIEDFESLTPPDKRFNVCSLGIHPTRRSVRLPTPSPSFALKQVDEGKNTNVQKDEAERSSDSAKGKGKEEMKQVEESKKHGQEGTTTPHGTRTPSSSFPNHLILTFDTPIKTNNAQTKTKTSTLPDEDDMTVWQLGSVNFHRAIHEDREIDTSFLTLDHKFKVRDYRAAQASGNGGSAAVVEPPQSAENYKPKSRCEKEVRSRAGKDKGDEEVVIEVQISRGEGSEIVIDLSAMEARRVKVKVKSSG